MATYIKPCERPQWPDMEITMRNLHKEITDRIVARLKAGVVPWRQPWSNKGFGVMPRNAVTNRAYSGANVILLWSRAQESAFTDPRWLTVVLAHRGRSIYRHQVWIKALQDELGQQGEHFAVMRPMDK